MKRMFLLIVPFILASCAEKKVVSYEEFERVKKEVERTKFATKQALAEIINVKGAIKEVNEELKKQNEINEILFKEVKEIKSKIKTEPQVGQIKAKIIEEESFYGKAVVISKTLNLRATPTSKRKDNILYVLKAGDIVEIVEKGPLWWKVRLSNGIEGYVYSKYLRELTK